MENTKQEAKNQAETGREAEQTNPSSPWRFFIFVFGIPLAAIVALVLCMNRCS